MGGDALAEEGGGPFEVQDVGAVEALSASLRALNAAVRSANPPTEVLEEARSLVDRALGMVAPHAHAGPYAQHALHLDTPRPATVRSAGEFFPYSPIVGPRNPISPLAEFDHSEGEVSGRVTLGAPYTGPPRSVHGGVIALLLDELLGYTGVANELGAFTGTLQIRYLALTPIGEPLELAARVARSEGRKVFIEGEILHQGRRTAEAEGIFIRPRVSLLPEVEAADE